MEKQEFIVLVKKRVANISVGAAALRNQGAPGIVKICRKYFIEKIILEELFLSLSTEIKFNHYLNMHTIRLLKKFDSKARSWGAARKALNLYFRELMYNKFIFDYYKNHPQIKLRINSYHLLEVPLDKDVAIGIKNNSQNKLPSWMSIKSLTKKGSALFQEEAARIAKRKDISRVHLDMIYWRASAK